MATTTLTLHNTPPRLNFGLIILLAAVAAGLVLGVHALKHTLADTVRNCPQDSIGLRLVNPVTGRIAILCEFKPGQWGRVICENGKCGETEEVTAFANQEARKNAFEYAVRNLWRNGYRQIEYINPGILDRFVKVLNVLTSLP